MKLKNYTDIPTERLKEILRFVKPPNVASFDLRVSNLARGILRGRAYVEGSSYHDTANPFIVVSIERNEGKFPTLFYNERQTRTRVYGDGRVEKYKTGGGYLPLLLLSREEAIVAVLAHETRHFWQAKHRKGRVWGARGKYSERDADAYAIRKVREWRRKQYG